MEKITEHMISILRNALKSLRRTSAMHDSQSRKKPDIVIISPGCGRAGSRKIQILINNKDLLEKIKNSPIS